MTFPFLYISWLPLLSGTGAAALGLLVLLKNPRQAANAVFFLTMLALAVTEGANFMVLRDPLPPDGLLFMRLAVAASSLLAGLLFALSLVAARPDWREHLSRRWLTLTFFGLGSVVFAWLALKGGFLSGPDLLADSPVFELGPLGQYFYVFFLLACAATLINLESLLRSTSGSSRWHVKYGVLGLGGITVGFVFVISQNLIYHVVRVSYIPALSAVLLLSLVPLAYGVIRAGFLEVEVFISRYVIYNSLAALVLGGYLVAIGLLARLMGYLGGKDALFWQFFLIFASGMALAVALLSADLRKRVKHFINRHFYANKYDYRLEWIGLSQHLSRHSSRQALAQAVADTLRETMFVREVSVWLADDDGARFSLAAAQGVPEAAETMRAEGGVPSWLTHRGRTIRAAELEEEVPLALAEHLDLFEKRLKAVLITPLLAGGRLLGFISVGPEATGRDFIEDDFDLLNSVAAQAAGVLLGSYLGASLAKAQEEQTFHRLASFVTHDLKNFVSMLSLVVQNAERHISDPEFQKDALATIRETVEKMKALSGKLSEARRQRFELHPETLRLDVLAREVAADIALNGADVTVAGDDPVEVSADREQLGKVLTNLLLNAAEAGARRIEVAAASADGWATLTVSDDGAGMEREFLERRLFKPFATTKKKGLGIGLYQSKLIVEAHGGRLEAESAPQAGTTFRLRLPRGGV